MVNTIELSELAKHLGQELQRQDWMIVTAESCTGGLLSAAITSVPGSSAWFERGYVTYSNTAKSEDLGVLPEAIELHGAVSEQVAMEMANGALLQCPDAHVAVSITGVAGPDGGTPGKPVGMVCFGFATRVGDGIATRAATQVFDGDRQQVRYASTEFALRGVLESVDARAIDVRTAA